MRYILLALLCLLNANAVIACAPPNAHPKARAERMEEFWRYIRLSSGFVYGVVQKDIVSSAPSGSLKILHVYWGGPYGDLGNQDLQSGRELKFQVGEEIRMIHDPDQGTCMPLPGIVMRQKNGSYGVVRIGPQLADGSYNFTGFLHSSTLKLLMDAEVLVPSRAVYKKGDAYPPAP